MASADYSGKICLGHNVDAGSDETSGEPYLYDPDELTTHAFVVGITGSLKTGFCIDIMEEAALNSVPVLLIDPKGWFVRATMHNMPLRCRASRYCQTVPRRRSPVIRGEQGFRFLRQSSSMFLFLTR